MRLIIVRRWRWSTFTRLWAQYARVPEIRISWDRRRSSDRRRTTRAVLTDHRRDNRRRGVPASWTASHHVMVEIDGRAATPKIPE